MTTLAITEVCRRTGLSARTLRFYEARGLVTAQRSAAGQRRYGVAQVARLHQITALKRAGFSLARIATLIDDGALDLDRLIAAQIADLTARRTALDEVLAGLHATQAVLARGEPVDLDTFCTLIKQGATTMTDEAAWQEVAGRYFTREEQARWEATRAMVPAGFNFGEYLKKWADLGSRIAAALPLDPASDRAQAFLAEWNTLLAPFKQVADTRMKTATVALYDRMDEWAGTVSPGFSKAVWTFIEAAAVARH